MGISAYLNWCARRVWCWPLFGALSAGGVFLYDAYRAGGVSNAWCYWAGDSVVCERKMELTVDGDNGFTAERTIYLFNGSSRSLRILGGTATCSCVVLKELPELVPPGTAVPLLVLNQATADVRNGRSRRRRTVA